LNPEPRIRITVFASDRLDRAARAEIIMLCEAAYNEDFTRLFERFPDSVHVLARDDRGVLVSHAEFVPRWLQAGGMPILRTAYVEAVATAPRAQRAGLATAVLHRLTDVVAADAAWELAALSPSDAGFYARRGWELWQGPLAIRLGERTEPTPPGEQVMIRRLPRTPATLGTTGLLTAEWREDELW
jgi:aminoglycoside 2'-N-acetyltransferase I